MGELRLEVRDFRDLTRWRWVLTGSGGTVAADHEVRLDAGCWQFDAFADLDGFIQGHAAPDRRVEDETRIVAQVGEWIGSEVLGPVAAALVRARPATVRVIVPDGEPAGARMLLFRPLQLAHADGTPLALQDVTLLLDVGGRRAGQSVPVGERLRVLGLFSMPIGGRPLDLRGERYAIVRMLREIGAGGRAVDVRVLQYGVTRDRLRDVLKENEGWDVIHVSGHGMPGELILEQPDGSPDHVTAGELSGLLDLARERLKLVTISACWSAALTVAHQRRLLGLPAPDTRAGGRGAGDTEPAPGDSSLASGNLAAELAERLGCTVLAMRYPVSNSFAIALADTLYPLLAGKGVPLPKALGIALREVVAVPPTAACPALSAATPALFGGRSEGLHLAAPRRDLPDSYDTRPPELPGFPPQPGRFIGRTAVMARASAALAPGSGIPGVLLHGMPGGGKTWCALELAYTHEHAFETVVWYKAPDEGEDVTGSLSEFALTLEHRLRDFRMVHVLADDAKLAAFAPYLTRLARQHRVLIVIDNIESLLANSGQWRDQRWEQVIHALCAHTGLGRVVLTSRRRPADTTRTARTRGPAPEPRAGILDLLAVDALSLDEALLLARELPNLRALMTGTLAGLGRDEARRLARGVLNIAHGHPKLLELADGQAANPERLATLVQAGDQAWWQAGGLPEGFFTTGEPRASGKDYRHVLAAWGHRDHRRSHRRPAHPVLVLVLPGRRRPQLPYPRRHLEWPMETAGTSG